MTDNRQQKLCFWNGVSSAVIIQGLGILILKLSGLDSFSVLAGLLVVVALVAKFRVYDLERDT